jgi:hypothetical protein
VACPHCGSRFAYHDSAGERVRARALRVSEEGCRVWGVWGVLGSGSVPLVGAFAGLPGATGVTYLPVATPWPQFGHSYSYLALITVVSLRRSSAVRGSDLHPQRLLAGKRHRGARPGRLELLCGVSSVSSAEGLL